MIINEKGRRTAAFSCHKDITCEVPASSMPLRQLCNPDEQIDLDSLMIRIDLHQGNQEKFMSG
jgi:hypothetical protein